MSANDPKRTLDQFGTTEPAARRLRLPLTGQLSVPSKFEPALFDAARFDAALDQFKLA